MNSTSQSNYTNLLSKFNKGDDGAFSVFYQMYINELYSYGLSFGCEKEQVKDIIQDVFMNVYFDKKRFSTINHLKFYLFRSVKNGIYNLIKSKSSQTEPFSDEDLNFTLFVDVLDEIIDEEDRIIIEQKISQLLSTLSNREKEAIYLRYIQEMEYSEIAEVMNISQHSARKLISKAISRIRSDNEPFIILLLFGFIIK